MKTKSKSLMLAVCLLLVSATLLGTASYAWFSMNTEVNVDGIEVEAYSDSIFLEVSQKPADEYAVSTTFNNPKSYLRLATHGFVTTAYTLTATLIDTDTYFNTSNVYYEKVTYADSNERFVKVTGLDTASSLTNLYESPIFVKITDDNAVAGTGTYYEKLGTMYKKLTLDAAALVVGYYTLSPVYTVIDDATAVAETDKTYYSYADGAYTEFTVEVGVTNVNGKYTAAEITPIAAEANRVYNGTGTFYKKVGNDFYLESNLSLGTNLKGNYYTISGAQPIQDSAMQNFSGSAYIKNGDDYSLLGTFTNENIKKLLYFGRTYSDSTTSGNENGSVSVIKDEKLADYRLMNTVYLHNAVNTNDSRNLQAKFKVGGTSAVKNALRVLLVVSDNTTNAVVNTVTYNCGTDATAYGDGGTNIVNLLKGNMTETLKVDIYVYFDGTDAVADNQTDGVLALSGHSVEIEFTVDTPPYN